MPGRHVLAACVTVLALAACAGPHTRPVTAGTPASSSAGSQVGESSSGGAAAPRHVCGTASKAHYRHVVWIWMENRTYDAVINGTGEAPELGRYADKCGLATNYHGITHPSLPNYVAAVGGSTFGITTDCTPADCSVDKTSLYGQVSKAGLGWRAYAESMTAKCDQTSYGTYAARHNPAVYFTPIANECQHRDVPMGGADGRFAHALANGLPAFSFVTPNLCDDGHDCSTQVADTWLGTWLDRITASPVYAAGKTVVFVTWDESTGESPDNHIATVVIAPTVQPGTRVDRRFDHYSLLRTTEQILGLPFLRNAADARSMRAAFGL